MDFSDQARKFPHISKEFLEWQQRGTKWPAEQSTAYIVAKRIPGLYPQFCEIPRIKRIISWIIVAFVVVVGAGIFLHVS